MKTYKHEFPVRRLSDNYSFDFLYELWTNGANGVEVSVERIDGPTCVLTNMGIKSPVFFRPTELAPVRGNPKKSIDKARTVKQSDYAPVELYRLLNDIGFSYPWRFVIIPQLASNYYPAPQHIEEPTSDAAESGLLPNPLSQLPDLFAIGSITKFPVTKSGRKELIRLSSLTMPVNIYRYNPETNSYILTHRLNSEDALSGRINLESGDLLVPSFTALEGRYSMHDIPAEPEEIAFGNRMPFSFGFVVTNGVEVTELRELGAAPTWGVICLHQSVNY